MISAIAIDDEPLALELIEEFCSRIPIINLEKTFTNPNTALKYLTKFPIDLVFLDINMPSMSGLNLSNLLKEDTIVIFTTAYSEYALEGYNLNALDYLLKPFEFLRFEKAVIKANNYFKLLQKNESAEKKDLFIRADYKLIKIPIEDINFIEGLGDYLKIYYGKDDLVVARMTMKMILDKLPANEFVRVHRSFIVSFKKIKTVRNKIITVENKEIPIGTSYEDAFTALLKN